MSHTKKMSSLTSWTKLRIIDGDFEAENIIITEISLLLADVDGIRAQVASIT